jgi:hypothetical protein
VKGPQTSWREHSESRHQLHSNRTIVWAQSHLAAVQKELGIHSCLNVGSRR